MKIFLDQLVQDLRYGLRGLARSRAFLLTTVMTLALGLALIAVAFTVIDAYVFRPYAVHNPDELHQIGWRSRDSGGQSFRWTDYVELRDRTDSVRRRGCRDDPVRVVGGPAAVSRAGVGQLLRITRPEAVAGSGARPGRCRWRERGGRAQRPGLESPLLAESVGPWTLRRSQRSPVRGDRRRGSGLRRPERLASGRLGLAADLRSRLEPGSGWRESAGRARSLRSSQPARVRQSRSSRRCRRSWRASSSGRTTCGRT